MPKKRINNITLDTINNNQMVFNGYFVPYMGEGFSEYHERLSRMLAFCKNSLYPMEIKSVAELAFNALSSKESLERYQHLVARHIHSQNKQIDEITIIEDPFFSFFMRLRYEKTLQKHYGNSRKYMNAIYLKRKER